jgi:small subunit ribosomal protein S5
MVRVPLKEGRTLHHDMTSKYGASKLVIRTATPGTGIIAGGALRAVFECLGVQDIVVKSQGSNTPGSMIRAAFTAFAKMNSPKSIAARRGKTVAEIIAGRDSKDVKKQEEVKEDKE